MLQIDWTPELHLQEASRTRSAATKMAERGLHWISTNYQTLALSHELAAQRMQQIQSRVSPTTNQDPGASERLIEPA